jgi:hypothetical protein
VEKPLEQFNAYKRSSSGVRANCKVCQSAEYAAYVSRNREKVRARARRYYEENAEKIKDYRHIHSERTKKYLRAYYTANKTELFRKVREKKKNCPEFYLRHLLRSRINDCIRFKYKAGSAVRDLGCTAEELLSYLDQDCLKKYGELYSTAPRGKYHIDHIRPLASFKLEDSEQFKQAVHYSNLQILLAEENMRKGAKCPSQLTQS